MTLFASQFSKGSLVIIESYSCILKVKLNTSLLILKIKKEKKRKKRLCRGFWEELCFIRFGNHQTYNTDYILPKFINFGTLHTQILVYGTTHLHVCGIQNWFNVSNIRYYMWNTNSEINTRGSGRISPGNAQNSPRKSEKSPCKFA